MAKHSSFTRTQLSDLLDRHQPANRIQQALDALNQAAMMNGQMGAQPGMNQMAMAGMGISAVLLYLGASGFGVVATVALLSLAFGSAACSEGPFWATVIEISDEQAGAAAP